MQKFSVKGENREFLGVIMIIFVSLVFILDPRLLTNPPLRSDDWQMLVEPIVFDSLELVNFSDRRPFLLSLFAILSPIFQLRIPLYYVVNWLLILFSGITFYKLIRYTFPKHRWLALPVAVIFLIYPVNYARTWLVISINTLSLLLGLIAILLLLYYSREGQPWRLVLTNLLVLISLGAYEAAIGIIFLASFLMALNPETPKKRRLWMLTMPAIVLFFILWRTVIQPELLTVSDFYLESFTVSPTILISRYVQGLFIFLFNWVGPLLNPLGEIKYWVFVIGGFVLIIFMAALLWLRINRIRNKKEKWDSERQSDVFELLKISGIGFLFWAAGYIPVIALWQPIFYGDGSRVNFSSIPGASLAIVALLGALFSFFFRHKNRTQKWVLIIVTPMVIAGIAYQIHAQNIRQSVWQVQQNFWDSMFELVPGIETGTKVIVVIPGYEKLAPFEMLPFIGDWETQSALRVLYNNQELFAENYYLNRPQEADNWQPIEGDLGRFIFVYYDPELDEIDIIQDPYPALGITYAAENYDPYERIIDFEEEMGEFRFLVD
jgi:general stress protein CsbA